MQDKNLHILHSQEHGFWCPGEARSQGISNNDTEYVEPKNSVPASKGLTQLYSWTRDRLRNS